MAEPAKARLPYERSETPLEAALQVTGPVTEQLRVALELHEHVLRGAARSVPGGWAAWPSTGCFANPLWVAGRGSAGLRSAAH